MIHHLYQARMWLEAGRIVRHEWSGFFSYPYLTESFFALAGGTFGFRLSRVVSFLGFLASCSVITGYFLREGRKKAAILSLAVLLSIPELFRNASWSYSDSFLIFFALLAYVEVIRKDGSPVLAVLWAGGASCCKYNGFLVLVSVCLLLPFYFKNMSRRTLIMSACAAVFTTAWWALPNILQWGNPVYPLFRGLFGPEYHVSGRVSEYYAAGSFSTSLNGFTDYLLLPIRISLYGEWNNPALFDGASGPLLLAGSILALPVLSKRRRKFLLPLLYILFTLSIQG
jgi:4-amino-4-deoxy-L-arabinose transferase-like glycosyltransferase